MIRSLEHYCYCSSDASYKNCCKRFHDGQLPKNAYELMRSRYSAYVLSIPDYIIKTTHPANPQYQENFAAWRESISQFSQSTIFDRLDVLDFQERNTMATVTFRVHYTQNSAAASFTEKSYFEKWNNRWLYLNGQTGEAANFVTGSPCRLLPLAYWGDPILRKKADPVTVITEDSKILVKEMKETMHAFKAHGLSAPQVHRSLRLFILQSSQDIGKEEVRVFINPKLSLPSKDSSEAAEYCLSIPRVFSTIERPNEITVEYTNLEGNMIKERLSSWEARLLMQHNDLLNGVLFIDRLDKTKRGEVEPSLQNLKKILAV